MAGATRRRADALAWTVLAAAFIFAFAILLQPSGSLVRTPMEHSRIEIDAKRADTAHTVSHASTGLSLAWERPDD